MATAGAAIEAEPRKVKLGGARAWLVWALSVTFVVYYFSFQTGYAIVNARVQDDAGLSVTQVATVAAVYTWVFAFCQFFSGALLDRLGAGKILPAAIALVTVGIFMFAHDTDYFEPAVTAGRRQSVWVGWLDVIGHSNAPSDGGFVRPPRTSHRLVDDGDVGRSTAL